MPLPQLKVPGIVGISTYVDCIYQHQMQAMAQQIAGTTTGPINQLRSVLVTLDFNELVANLRHGLLESAEEQVAATAAALEAGGADFLVVTSGTTSTLTARAKERVSIEFLDLAEAAWTETGGVSRVGLLSTRQTAVAGIFDEVAKRRGASLLLPESDVAAAIDEVIFGELVRGTVTAAGVEVLRDAVAQLAAAGALSVILGNTDMALAVDLLRRDCPVPLIDSARAHARVVAKAALHGTAPGLSAEIS